MKRSGMLWVMVLLLTPFLFGARGCGPAGPANELFEQAWSDFDQHYSYFTYKNIDWDAVKEQYAPEFAQDMDAEAFAEKLNDVLQVLHDWHVSVTSPGGEIYGYNGTYDVNRPAWSITSQYITGGVDLADGHFSHGIVGDNIAYLDITSLVDSDLQGISDSDIEEIFQMYAGANGMIIDIRDNNGGNEVNAARFCSRLTDETYEYGYTRTRNGTGHDDFDEPESHALEPSTGTHFTGPIVGLIGKRCMSSAEWFTLMMKRNPNVTLIGERTRGASGFPQTYSLSNGVSYAISSWMAYTWDGAVIEDNGIAPDIAIPFAESYDDSHDYVLERAIAFIQNGETAPTSTSVPGSATTTTMPGAGSTTTTVSGTSTITTTVPASTTTTSVAVSEGPVISSFTVSESEGMFGPQYTFTCQATDPDGIAGYWWDFDGDSGGDVVENWWAFDEESVQNTATALGIDYYIFAGQYTAWVVAWDTRDNYTVASTVVTVQ